MNITTTIQYKGALEHRARLLNMLEVARTTLSQRDLIYFERSVQNLIRAVDLEIEAYQVELVNLLNPTWVTLGEFVVNGRVLPPLEGTFFWNAFEAPIQSVTVSTTINFQQPSLFEITRSADLPNPVTDAPAVFNLHTPSHPSV